MRAQAGGFFALAGDVPRPLRVLDLGSVRCSVLWRILGQAPALPSLSLSTEPEPGKATHPSWLVSRPLTLSHSPSRSCTDVTLLELWNGGGPRLGQKDSLDSFLTSGSPVEKQSCS